MRLFGAYVHCKPDGIPFYVGKGRVERAKRLDASHHNVHHARVVTKYGRENIGVGFIPCSSEAIAFDLEKGLIKCLKRANVKLANLTEGGEGVAGPKSPEHIAKLSLALKGHKGSMLGKKHSESTRKLLREKCVGRVSPRKGAKNSTDHIEKQRQATVKYFSNPEAVRKHKDLTKDQMKPVTACGVEFESIHAFCRYTGKALTTIARWRKKGWQDKIDTAYKEVQFESK